MRDVKRWRDISMALGWAAAGMMEARAGFRQLNAYRQLPAVRHALADHQCSTIPKARGRVQDCPEPHARANVRTSRRNLLDGNFLRVLLR
jgi:hypothetical protein